MNYSSIFKKYTADSGVPFYNILRKVQLPSDKTSDLYERFIVPYTMPWVHLSYHIYNDISFYWLILLANDGAKLNPLYASAGDEIYIIKSSYLNTVIDAIMAAAK